MMEYYLDKARQNLHHLPLWNQLGRAKARYVSHWDVRTGPNDVLLARFPFQRQAWGYAERLWHERVGHGSLSVRYPLARRARLVGAWGEFEEQS